MLNKRKKNDEYENYCEGNLIEIFEKYFTENNLK